MKRYSLHHQTGKDKTRVDVHNAVEFSTQAALAEAFNAELKTLPEGQSLAGKDWKSGRMLHFSYHATVEEVWEGKLKYIRTVLKNSCNEVRTWLTRTRNVVDLIGDVANEFSWSADTFKDAARIRVYRQALIHVEESQVSGLDAAGQLAALRDFATAAALRGAQFPGRSTSPMSNVVDLETTAIWADLAEQLERPNR